MAGRAAAANGKTTEGEECKDRPTTDNEEETLCTFAEHGRDLAHLGAKHQNLGVDPGSVL